MPEDMPNIEGGSPTPPEASSSTEEPISQRSFREVFALEKRLERQKETASGDALTRIETELAEASGRKNQLIAEVEQESGFLYLDQDLETLKLMSDVGELSPSDILDALKVAPQLDNLAGLEPSDPYVGVREWYYRKNLDEILDALRKRGEKHIQEQEGQQRQQAQASSSPDTHRTTNAAFEQKRGRIEESIIDPETGRSGDRLIDARKEGAEKAKEVFRGRLRILIEEQADQSFDQNWRLVYPLELTIMDLMPKGEEADIVAPLEGGTWQPFSLSELRRDLSKELQAYRNIHNYIYVHRRVGGVTPLIEAGALLSRDTIETLLHIPEVAEALRKFEEIGNECYHAKQESFKMLKARKKGEDPSSKEKEWGNKASQKEGEAKNLMSNSDSREDGPFWARRIAGGLYSGLHESARQDMQVNESGDFFTDRLFHASERAAIQWNNWGRNPRPQLFEALNLRVDGFFENVFWKKFKKNKNGFKTFCDNMGISYTFRIGKNGEKDGFSSLDLSRTKFEGMDFSNEKSDSYLPVKSDEVRLANLTLDDADKIRKAIFDPRGFLDDPSMATMKKAYEVFKHLKGAKRSDWVRDICRQVVLLYRDTVHPKKENAPPRSRKCPGQEIYPEMVPWTNNEVTNQLTRMTPPLTKEDEETLLKEFVGTRAQIRQKEDVGAVAKVAGSVAGEFLKALLGLK